MGSIKNLTAGSWKGIKHDYAGGDSAYSTSWRHQLVEKDQHKLWLPT